MPRRPSRVREPIQVYLRPEERRLLDRLAQEAGVSRAEVLRRGLTALARVQQADESPMLEFARSLEAGAGLPADVAERHDEVLGRLLREEW